MQNRSSKVLTDKHEQQQQEHSQQHQKQQKYCWQKLSFLWIFQVIPLTIATQTITYATAAEVAAAITALADVVSNAAATAVAILECRICTNSSHGAKQNAIWS